MTMTHATRDYYVYVYSNPDTRQPFYVGKGHGRRALAHMDFGEAENANSPGEATSPSLLNKDG